VTHFPYDKYQDDLMAFLDGTLDAAGRERLERVIEADPACRAECHWFEQAREDLESMGDAMLENVPQVDLVEAVMGAVVEAKSRPKTVGQASRKEVRTARYVDWRRWALAAAILLVLGLGAFYAVKRAGEESTVPPYAEVVTPGRGTARPAPAGKNIEKFDDIRNRLRGAISGSLAPSAERAPEEGPFDGVDFAKTDELSTDELSLGEVVATRRDAVFNGEALGRLERWARLNDIEARGVVSSEGAAMAALVGAAQSLPAAEAKVYLLAALDQFSEDPYVRMELAKRLLEDPESKEAAEMQLAALRELDPENSLAVWLEALALLREGDAAALDLLAEAASLDRASAYALDAAQFREQALLANGMDPEVARVLTAMTGGIEEYDFLSEVANELLAYGKGYEEQNDFDAAQQIYEAVYQLGVQLTQGAQFSQEQLAALDIQRAAIELLNGVSSMLGDTEQLETLAVLAEGLRGGIGELVEFFGRLNEVFSQPVDTGWLLEMADHVLDLGDLAIFD